MSSAPLSKVASSAGSGVVNASVGTARASASRLVASPLQELAVAGGEGLVLVVAFQVELLDHDRAGDGTVRAVDGEAGRLDGDFLEDEAGDVLGPVDVADLRVGRHDHRRRSVPAGEPGAGGVGEDAVIVVEHVLAEVEDRSVVGLAVLVERHLRQAAVEEGDELRLERLDLAAVHARR